MEGASCTFPLIAVRLMDVFPSICTWVMETADQIERYCNPSLSGTQGRVWSWINLSFSTPAFPSLPCTLVCSICPFACQEMRSFSWNSYRLLSLPDNFRAVSCSWPVSVSGWGLLNRSVSSVWLLGSIRGSSLVGPTVSDQGCDQFNESYLNYPYCWRQSSLAKVIYLKCPSFW